MGSDEPQFRVVGKFKFEFLNSEQGDDPALASAYYAKDMAETFAREPLWLATGGWEISPGEAQYGRDRHAVAFVARHEASGRSVEGRLVLAPDPSHWVKAEVFIGAFRVFLGYFDRVWEQWDIWPSDASGEGEAPARVGKRQNWVGLSAEAWPSIRSMWGEDGLMIEVPGL